MSDQTFTPHSLSIRQLFTDSQSLYRVPEYQRPYKWGEEQIEQLWDDLQEAFESDEENYFLGSIITAKPLNDEKTVYLDIVDGQQRLTTLVILFSVLRDLYPNLNESEQGHNVVQKNVIESAIKYYGNSNRLTLFTHRQHQSDFDDLIVKGQVFEFPKPTKTELKQDEEPKFKFINSAYIFRDKLSKLAPKEIDLFVNYLFDRVRVIRIDCSSRGFAIKLFQVLNDRGLNLTVADLIKSFLLEKLYSKYSGDEECRKQKENQFISDWNEITADLKEIINLTSFFNLYGYYELAQNPKKSIHDELEIVFESKDPIEVVSKLRQFAKIYSKEIYEKEDNILFSFWYLPWSMYWQSILMTALFSKYSDYERLKIVVRRFYYLYWISGRTLSAIKQTSFKLISLIKENKNIEYIESILNEKLIKDDIINAVKLNLSSNDIYNTAWCKSLLILIEYEMTDNSNSAFIYWDSNLQIEHVLPKNYSKAIGWDFIDTKVAQKWLNSAGNLTLLSGRKNVVAGNSSFQDKIKVYNGKHKNGSQNDKMTAFRITQEISRDFELNTYGKQWNEKAMLDRYKWFMKHIAFILDVEELRDLNIQEI
ncbi:DUF262 domain-containing protein [Neisseria sp. Ec49-e6-T10]|uniref:DUF262 domain-containing protein n=1 Tax=Neisseria sp. Ec49-e6-T10 TaxID=3140744 RepID=UPI003EBA6717